MLRVSRWGSGRDGWEAVRIYLPPPYPLSDFLFEPHGPAVQSDLMSRRRPRAPRLSKPLMPANRERRRRLRTSEVHPLPTSRRSARRRGRQNAGQSRDPLLSDRIASKATADSRTESFKTAPEVPYSSEDEDDGRSTLRPVVPSEKTSQSTVRQVNGAKPHAVGLGLGLESTASDGNLTPRTKGEFVTFDGEWGANPEVEKEWDDNLGRHVTVRKRRTTPKTNGHKPEVLEDVTVTPTNATKALRSMALQESPLVYPRRVVSDRPRSQRVTSNSGFLHEHGPASIVCLVHQICGIHGGRSDPCGDRPEAEENPSPCSKAIRSEGLRLRHVPGKLYQCLPAS